MFIEKPELWPLVSIITSLRNWLLLDWLTGSQMDTSLTHWRGWPGDLKVIENSLFQSSKSLMTQESHQGHSFAHGHCFETPLPSLTQCSAHSFFWCRNGRINCPGLCTKAWNTVRWLLAIVEVAWQHRHAEGKVLAVVGQGMEGRGAELQHEKPR